MNKMTLKELYEIAYNGQAPFAPAKKNAANLFFANIVTYLSDSVANKSESVGIIDVYLFFIDKMGYNLNDVYHCINKATTKSHVDSTLFKHFSADSLFDDCREMAMELDEADPDEVMINKSTCSGSTFPFTHNLMFIYGPKEMYLCIANQKYNTQNKDRMSSDIYKKFKSVISLFFESEEKGINFDYDKTICHNTKLTFEYLGISTETIANLREKMLQSCTVPLCETIKNKRFNTQKTAGIQNIIAIKAIKDKIIGQKEAVDKVQKRLISASYGFKLDGKPVASFLLTGPTGVGKTETAKAVASNCFNDKIFIVDMSTYKNDIDVSRLLGGSPNYVGYGDKNAFCDFLQKNPQSVILFDEIEKAHPEVLDLLMRILDEAQFINAKGETVSLEECVIFCTTNFTQNNKSVCGFNHSGPSAGELMTKQNGLKKELVGRFTEVIEYLPLTKTECKQIAKVSFLSKLIESFEKKNKFGLKLKITDEVLDLVVEQANIRLFGARDLRKSIQANIVDPICEYISQHNPENVILSIDADGTISELEIPQTNKSISTNTETTK